MRLGTPSGLSTMSTGVPSCEVRHVLFRQDAADHALVAVATGHLVADLELALDGDVDLHHLDHARRQLVAAWLRRSILSRKCSSRSRDHRLRDRVSSCCTSSAPSRPGSRPSTCAGSRSSSRRRASAPLLSRTLPLSSTSLPVVVLPTSIALDLAEERVAEDLHLLVARPLELGALRVLDRLGALVLLRALAREDAGVDHDAADARRHLERAVAHVAGLFAEDRAQQLLFGGELGLALRRDLADQDVARLHLGADAHDAGVVEVLEGLFADVRDVLA